MNRIPLFSSCHLLHASMFLAVFKHGFIFKNAVSEVASVLACIHNLVSIALQALHVRLLASCPQLLVVKNLYRSSMLPSQEKSLQQALTTS